MVCCCGSRAATTGRRRPLFAENPACCSTTRSWCSSARWRRSESEPSTIEQLPRRFCIRSVDAVPYALLLQQLGLPLDGGTSADGGTGRGRGSHCGSGG